MSEEVPDYNRDGDNYYFTLKELKAFLATHQSKTLEALKQKWPKEKPIITTANQPPRELIPSEQELRINKNHQAIGSNTALKQAWLVVEQELNQKI